MNFYYANLAFLSSYGEGTTNDEIESEIYRVAFQVKEETHYDRNSGGSFQNLEQEPVNLAGIALTLKFQANLIESIAEINESRNNNPYIVVGFSDINSEIKNETFIVNVSYKLLQNLSVQGNVILEF